MARFIDFTGRRFGKWTVVRRAENTVHGQARWMCRCECGRERDVESRNLKRGSSTCCGRGACCSYWAGGRGTTKGGYVWLYDEHHPNANPRRYVFEHVAIMAEHLGRPIRKGETIHHKNGIRNDNRLENLELWGGSHPPGQRVEDLVQHAKEILALYEPEALK